MKILVISRSEWSDSNSTGSTISSLFGGFPQDKLANLYFRDAVPNNKICNKYFSITEFSALSTRGKEFTYLFNDVANETVTNQKNIKTSSWFSTSWLAHLIEKFLLKKFRGTNFYFIYLIQDLIWRISWWKSPSLHNFLTDYSPDIVFFPSFGAPYTQRVARYVADYSGAKLVVYHADDHFFQDTKNFGILRKLFFAILTSEVNKTIVYSSLNYAISESLKEKYSDHFKKPFYILRKGIIFSVKKSSEEIQKYQLNKIRNVYETGVIKCIYIGSLEYGRWKTLKILIDAMYYFLNSSVRFELSIYSQYRPNDRIISQISVEGISKFYGMLPVNDVETAIKKADLVLHIESFDSIDIQLTRYSFSTKLVDCLASMTPVLAIGPSGIASMDYLVENDIAICVTIKENIVEELNRVLHSIDDTLLSAQKAYGFALQNYDILLIRKMLYEQMADLI